VIYITGDLHGNPCRLQQEELKKVGITIKAGDYIIICGDFGCVWGGVLKEKNARALEILEAQPFTTLFIDGNHENFDLLNALPVEEWHGGKVHKIRNNIFHLLRGEIFDIEGKSFFCFGGASSTDQDRRIEGQSWWPQENPSQEEYQYAISNLEKANYNVDYVLTHTSPRKFLRRNTKALVRIYECSTSKMLDIIQSKVKYKYWFYGHYHLDCIDAEFKCAALYYRMIKLTKRTNVITTFCDKQVDWYKKLYGTAQKETVKQIKSYESSIKDYGSNLNKIKEEFNHEINKPKYHNMVFSEDTLSWWLEDVAAGCRPRIWANIMNESYHEKSLPEYLQKDIDLYVHGKETNDTMLDCYYCNLQATINEAEQEQDINSETAWYLREKYLGLRKGNNT